MINFSDYFSTPIGSGSLDNFAAINDALTSVFNKMKSRPREFKNQSSFNTTLGDVFDSRFDLFEMKNESIIELSLIFDNILKGMVSQCTTISLYEVDKLKFSRHAWFHITGNGGQKTLHNHPNASWSIVYYVDAGNSDGCSGRVQFYDPRMGASMFQDKTCVNLSRKYRFEGLSFVPKTGSFLIFPSYLYHEVLPYSGNRSRISVASNYWLS